MSNRDSLGYGDLLPQDVVDIFAQEKHSKKGRKQHHRSLGRALGWLKGRKSKKVGDKAQNPGLGPAFDLALDVRSTGHQGPSKGTLKSGKQGQQQSNSHAVPKRDDDDDKKTPAPLLLQENVFIEASRPKYLEDLHTEALEGLKLMQQEERNLGPECQDNESTISTVSARAEVDGGGFTTDSTLPDTSSMVSVQSSVSSRSSRSGLTRQGSTFRPLKSEKSSRTRRRHRRTIGSIPQHLQREFGLDRAEWAVSSQLEEEMLNGSGVPQLAVHSPPETNTETLHPAHVDDMALLQRVGSVPAAGERPWSLAVPGMTTASGQSGPPSPVMSMSPQAAYLSKIIPNAVLPPSIEVVEISRGSSRNSVRTVSKSSLMMSSPPSSRASSRASTTRSTSSRSSAMSSVSRQRHFQLSDSSCWSNSDSDTLVSDSSTISSSSTPRQSEAQEKHSPKKQNKGSGHTNASKAVSNGTTTVKGEDSKKDGAFVRSLSVMKSKRAPPPPSRSYSLHNKMKRRSRDLADVKILPGQSSEGNMKKIDSPGYNADTSSLDESYGSNTPSPLKLKMDSTKHNTSTTASSTKKEECMSNSTKIISPSSGYSSQDATSPHNFSPKHKMGLLAKLHKFLPVSPTTQPEAGKTRNVSVIAVNEKSSVKALRELLNIPPHPKIHAPPPPPPEVWSHSPRSIELLLGPSAPDNTYAIVKKNPKDKRPYRQPPSTHADELVESKKVNVSPERSLNVENSERLTSVDAREHKKVQVSAVLNEVLVRTVERDGQRLPVIAEEHKVSTHNTKNPAISSAHISPRLVTKHNVNGSALVSVHVPSPESSWPLPPPPIPQVILASRDETDFPLPPPPIIIDCDPVAPGASNTSISLQDNNAPPLDIPPPPSYTAPPPPIKTFAISEKAKQFSPVSKDIPPPSVKPSPSPTQKEVEVHFISQPSPQARKKISPAVTAHPPTPPISPASKHSAVPPPPEVPPSPPQLKEATSSKTINVLPRVSFSSPSNPKIPSPPVIIPTTQSKEVVIIHSTLADAPSPQPSMQSIKEVSPTPINVNGPKETITQVTKIISYPASEIITTVSGPKPSNIPPLSQTVSKPPENVVQTQAATSQTKEISYENLPPTVTEVTSPSIVVVTQASNKIDPIPEVSIPQKEASPELSREELSSTQDVSQPKDLPPQPAEVISKELPSPSEEPRPKDVAPTVKIKSELQEVTPPSSSVVEEKSTSGVERSLEILLHPSDKEAVLPPEETEHIKDSGPVSEAPLQQIEIALLEEETDPDLPPHTSFLTPPQSIPPPPPFEQPPPDALPLIEPNEQRESPSEEQEEAVNIQSNEPKDVPLNYAKEPGKLSLNVSEKEPVDEPKEPEKVPVDEPKELEKVQSEEPKEPEKVPVDEPKQPDIVSSEEPKEPEQVSSVPEEPEKVLSGVPKEPEKVPSEEPEKVPSGEPKEPEKVPSDIPNEPETVPSVQPKEPENVPSDEPKEPEAVPPTAKVPSTEPTTPAPSSQTEDVPNQEPSSDVAQEKHEEPVLVQTKEEVSGNVNLSSTQGVNGNLDSPKSEDETVQASTETPQKPVRKSLIISSPPSPPATTATSPTLSKATATATKTHTAMAPSMNLQEAIRLRTAARSHNGPSSRLSIHSPPGFDVRKSPTSTASFIFSKSNKKVVIETRSEAKMDKHNADMPTTKADLTAKKELKVPPPVAKKPKAKTKEVECDDTAG
ncbi:unnamed protein product [Knipowitschia caucasica]